MEDPFVTAVLSYTILSCGFLLLALFHFRKQPHRFALIGFWMMCAHIVYKLIWMAWADKSQYELPIPVGLAYPALLYLFAEAYYRSISASVQRMFFFTLPFSVHVVLFAVAFLQPAESHWLAVYSMGYHICCILSLLIYAALTVKLYSRSARSSTPTDVLIRQLTLLCFGLVMLTYLVLYEVHIRESSIGFEVRPMVFLFLAIGFALVLKYQLTYGPQATAEGARHEQEQAELADVPLPELPDVLVRHVADVIERELIRSKLFLNPAVSLDMLSQRTAIPRHQLTQVFNRYYKKAFYPFIAAARIEYAITRISETAEVMTLDSLSYECGFNSKTSFNRYFKEHTGMTPSEYRSSTSQMLCIQQ